MAEMTRRLRREEARRLFLTGECTSNAEIGRQLGMKAATVARYRREERWDDLRRKIDRKAAEELVAKLAGERTNLNPRHFRYWDVLLSHAGQLMQRATDLDDRSLERLASVIDRAQKGQRLARGLSLTGENEEQIRASAQAESRALVDAFIDAVKAHVADEEARDRIRMAVLQRFPAPSEEAAG